MTEAWTQWEGRVVNGEFHLQKYLSSSGHGAVFLTAYRGQGPQPAVIKLIPADAATAESQFSRWRLAEGLSHPHLLRVLHKGRCQLGATEMVFLVTEYADENLAQIIPERPLTPDEAQQMLEPLLDALSYLHHQGLVHGGLKPANIMAANDQLKLSIDSLSRIGESAGDHGKHSAYDPPEKGSGAASPAWDIWSLGMTLTEVLTQHLPSSQGQNRIEPALPKEVPAALADIVRGCLIRDPARRWTIANITERLHPQVQPVASVPQEPAKLLEATPVRTAQADTKRRLPLTLIITVVAVAAILLLLALLRHEPNKSQGIPEEKTEQKPKSQEPETVTPKAFDKPSPTSPSAARAATTSTRGSTESEVVDQVLPQVSQAARETIQGTVRVNVRVQVDPSGRVVGSEFDSAGPSKYFSRLAMAAAQNWRFTQSGRDHDARREFVLHFEFRNSDTKAFAKPVLR
jgi:TonB family protein